MIETEHLDPDLVAAYLESELSGEEREWVEEHLSTCDECCRELVTLDETVRSLPRRRPIHRYLGPAVAAAAILAVVLVARPWLDNGRPTALEPAGIERTAPDIASSRLEVLSPANDEVLRSENLVLAWRPAGEGARYQVTITTAEGDSVWASMTAETNATIPPDAVEPDREYLWYVDALLPDGRTSTTGISYFRTAP